MKKSFGPRTLIYPAPVWVIGTYDKARKPNVMTLHGEGSAVPSPHASQFP